MRQNLLHEPSEYPFVHLAREFNGPGRRWWERKLKHLLKRFGTERVARSVLNVPYFAYPSRRFGHERLSLSSQQYGFALVRAAVQREAVIVFMQKANRWLRAVPELDGYGRCFPVINSQNPVIRLRNCGGFETIVEAIERAEAD